MFILFADDWAEKADSNSSSPDGGGGKSVPMETAAAAAVKEEEDMDDSGSQAESTQSGTRTVKPKKKPKVVVERSQTKDHLNIVFIGHVGEQLNPLLCTTGAPIMELAKFRVFDGKICRIWIVVSWMFQACCKRCYPFAPWYDPFAFHDDSMASMEITEEYVVKMIVS